MRVTVTQARRAEHSTARCPPTHLPTLRRATTGVCGGGGGGGARHQRAVDTVCRGGACWGVLSAADRTAATLRGKQPPRMMRAATSSEWHRRSAPGLRLQWGLLLLQALPQTLHTLDTLRTPDRSALRANTLRPHTAVACHMATAEERSAGDDGLGTVMSTQQNFSQHFSSGDSIGWSVQSGLSVSRGYPTSARGAALLRTPCMPST
eukprot:COSAG01_NODE_4817_length_4724_cov_3.025081_7_plen_207_part_00